MSKKSSLLKGAVHRRVRSRSSRPIPVCRSHLGNLLKPPDFSGTEATGLPRVLPAPSLLIVRFRRRTAAESAGPGAKHRRDAGGSVASGFAGGQKFKSDDCHNILRSNGMRRNDGFTRIDCRDRALRLDAAEGATAGRSHQGHLGASGWQLDTVATSQRHLCLLKLHPHRCQYLRYPATPSRTDLHVRVDVNLLVMG